ncbi:hypothetical protein CH296_27840 [Rhodococcus sp. 14-2496-1d]|uniref:hypothetical protein n=1 Tax=Rhodococcus sp. 14-2496-1d TaxID=2023146 RepID=UPI000B9C58FC|nr:hypothetical protein [Rhodococcus sp. 14-2496-1d]OZF25350.1 hypothetical protein CH296_27840 [Rhodococcus sp. 14-2496-1d]
MSAGQVADSIGRALFSVVRAEEMDRRRGDAWEELNDLRCLDCEIRYAERQQYRCEYPGTHTDAYPIYGAGHCYEKAEVDRLIIATGETS